jgi:hypothetical protein
VTVEFRVLWQTVWGLSGLSHSHHGRVGPSRVAPVGGEHLLSGVSSYEALPFYLQMGLQGSVVLSFAQGHWSGDILKYC